MADEDFRDEVEEALKLQAQDHILSFVHTPDLIGGLRENDPRPTWIAKKYDLDEEEVMVSGIHDLTGGFDSDAILLKPTLFTQERMMMNEAKAISLQGKAVIPTGESGTVAFYVKGFSASIGSGHRNRQLRSNVGFSAEKVDDAYMILDNIDQEVGINLKTGLFSFGNALKDGDGSVLEFNLLASNEGVVDEKSIWFPNIYTDAGVPSGLPKDIRDRLKAISEHESFIPLRKKSDGSTENEAIGKKNGISPITAYYIMRYLSPYLLDSGMVEQALPTAEGKVSRIIVKRSEDYDFREKLQELITGERKVDGKRKSIDEMFPFERIRTTYDYPADYPIGYTEEVSDNVSGQLFGFEGAKFIRCPDPLDAKVIGTIKYGLLQKIYAVMSPSQRAAMQKDLFEVFVEKSELQPHYLHGVQPFNEVLGGRENVYFPVAKNGNGSLSFTEVLLAFVEADFKGLSKEDAIKLITNRETNEKEYVSEGAVVNVPGLLLLFAEKAGKHTFFDTIHGKSTKSLSTADGGKKLNDTEGMEYIEELMNYVLSGNSDEEIEEKENAIEDIAGSDSEDWTCEIIPKKESSQLTIISDGGVMLTLTVSNKLFGKGIRDELVDYEVGKEGSNASLLSRIVYNSEYGDDEAQGESLEAFAETTGDIMRRAQPYGARAFNALGYLVEEGMLNCAESAAESVSGVAITSEFDRMVIGLIGTNKYPGLATIHASYHYQFLLHQMISPIKSWDVVDKELFQQGTFLALESFFDKPAQKALFYMLNKMGYIGVGGKKNTEFFTIPERAEYNDASFANLQNKFAQMVIGYYRLMFAQIRNRLVIARQTQEARKRDETTADIRVLWKSLISDAIENTPDPKIFALILRFLAEESTGDQIITIPAWMPVLPEDMLEAKERKTNENEPAQYLKWAYGTNSVDLEFFSEVAAAYHASKALSYFDNYPLMVRRFVDAVDEDSGHAFLFAILMSPNQPNLTGIEPSGMPVNLMGRSGFTGMDGSTLKEQTETESEEAKTEETEFEETEYGEMESEEQPPEFRGDLPAEEAGVWELLKEIQSNSTEYIDGELEDEEYATNLEHLMGDLRAQVDGESFQVSGPMMQFNPLEYYDEQKQGYELIDGEKIPSKDLLGKLSFRLMSMEV